MVWRNQTAEREAVGLQSENEATNEKEGQSGRKRKGKGARDRSKARKKVRDADRQINQKSRKLQRILLDD